MARLAKLRDAGADELREKAELQEALVRCDVHPMHACACRHWVPASICPDHAVPVDIFCTTDYAVTGGRHRSQRTHSAATRLTGSLTLVCLHLQV